MAFPDISTVRSYGGGALPSVLTGSGISSTGTSFTVADASTWVENGTSNPLGTSGPFVVAIDYGETNEEKVLCSSLNLTTNTVTVYSSGGSIGRAYDNCNVPLGTSAGTGVTHAANAVVVPVFTSVEAQAANNVGSKTLGLVTSPGDLLVGNGTQSLTRKAIGTSGQVLSSNGTTVNWQKVAPANVDPSGTSAGQVLISTGSSSAPTWQDNKGQAYVGSSTPSATISGALWWDTTNAILKVYNDSSPPQAPLSLRHLLCHPVITTVLSRCDSQRVTQTQAFATWSLTQAVTSSRRYLQLLGLMALPSWLTDGYLP